MNIFHKLFFLSVIVFFLLNINQTDTFKLEVEQHGTKQKIRGLFKTKRVNLDKAPFTFILTLPKTDENIEISRVKFIATLNKSTFKDAMQGKSIKDMLGAQFYPYAADIGNKHEYIVLGENGYSSWYYTQDSANSVVTDFMEAGEYVICRIRVKDFFINGLQNYGRQNISISELNEDKVYFYFEMRDRYKNLLKRQFLVMKFR